MGGAKREAVAIEEAINADKELVEDIVQDKYDGDWSKAFNSITALKTNFITEERIFKEFGEEDVKEYVKYKRDMINCKFCEGKQRYLTEGNHDIDSICAELNNVDPECGACKEFHTSAIQVLPTFSDGYNDDNYEIPNILINFYKNDKPKSYYNYLLIDAKVWNKYKKELDYQNIMNETNNPPTVDEFMKSIFYVGKGKGERYLDHFTDAENGNKSGKCEKILSTDVTVVQFNLQSAENLAFNIEACVMVYLKSQNINLTNTAAGQCHDFVRVLTDELKKDVGKFAIDEAFKYFLIRETSITYTTKLKPSTSTIDNVAQTASSSNDLKNNSANEVFVNLEEEVEINESNNKDVN